MERTPRTILITTVGVIFFILIALYGYGRFGRYINGPEIVSISIQKYQSIDSFLIPITGTVKNTQKIAINNRSITLNQDNSFNEIVVVSPGLTIIDIDMSDSFGKTKQYQYHIYSTAESNNYQPTLREAIRKQEEKNLLEHQKEVN